MTKTLSRTTSTASFLVVPTAHAAEPSATRISAVAAAEMWKTDKTNVLDRCVSLTANELAAALAAAAARPSPSTRNATGLARGGSDREIRGRRTSTKGRLTKP